MICKQCIRRTVLTMGTACRIQNSAKKLQGEERKFAVSPFNCKASNYEYDHILTEFFAAIENDLCH